LDIAGCNDKLDVGYIPNISELKCHRLTKTMLSDEIIYDNVYCLHAKHIDVDINRFNNLSSLHFSGDGETIVYELRLRKLREIIFNKGCTGSLKFLSGIKKIKSIHIFSSTLCDLDALKSIKNLYNLLYNANDHDIVNHINPSIKDLCFGNEFDGDIVDLVKTIDMDRTSVTIYNTKCLTHKNIDVDNDDDNDYFLDSSTLDDMMDSIKDL
jgi:hypothetical protein